ncbi:hypothetical protein VD0002_g1466 [Verticillium dahliae]|uniref:Ankyrin repeat protein n=1 Tax=Verticillium dahliae TaxID=27337 RepID=A0AA44WDM3_VERDA|nr:PHO85 cyclin-7 [Verticillium dahliae VDG2]KAH6703664.1 ankyrin repeat protein [Verticillium dahliae]PNH28930.1 hypothetical protein BJF96_g7800 [Verticillium dahliae]PNH57170.1 hypothetical protein VD0003_g597 [Verticillium dahliae]PNH68619.1 hypothetical protein VD0002_g1466 [Verticillium dahliae]
MATQNLQELPAPHSELVNYIAGHPEKSMIEILDPYRRYEAQLRSVFAQDRNSTLLNDPYVNLLPVFNENTKNIKTRARNLSAESEEEKSRYIMSLPDDKRREDGSPAVVQSIAEFRKNFSVFSESSLVDMDWSNVVAAGSSVVNTLLPVPPEFNTNKRKLREYYHEKFCPASDVDLFLYGLTHDEAIEKIKQIEQAIRDAILTEVTVVRTKYAITIASQYPTRHVQIVLRVYKSIGEILTGFDIDAAGGAYNGKQVYVTPRALGSFITQINHIDLTRRSPSYENRLSKYSHRNFEIYWPELDRSRVDPTIFERSFQRTLGLARLLVLERLPTSSVRDSYLDKRREERGRPAINRNFQHRVWGNIKDAHEDEIADWVDETEVSNYHTFSVPYGERFNAKKIEKLCYTKDLLLNAEWNQHKDRQVYLHRHPAFFGRVQDVIEDCCGTCPKAVTPEEIEIAEKEAEIYISGPVSFLIDDPGRQQIGSFNPLTQDDWTDMAYVGNTARLCQSIVDGNVDEVLDWLSQEGADPNQRDYTGRSPLHLAVMNSTPDVARALVDHGARLTARLADGNTALHLAAERGNVEMVRILMERSITNEAEEEEKQDRRRKALKEAASGKSSDATNVADRETDPESDADSESDGELIDGEGTEIDARTMATGSFVDVQKAKDQETDDAALNGAPDEPDFYKSDVLAWDIPCSPLHLAIAQGHEDVVTTLCNYGSDALLPVKFLDEEKQPEAALLTLVLALRLPEDKAKSMAKLLLKLGATSSQADIESCTVFHRYVAEGSHTLIDTLWDNDQSGTKSAINHLVPANGYYRSKVVGPLHSAIQNEDTDLVLKLLNAGAKHSIDFATWLKAAKMSKGADQLGDYQQNQNKFARSVEQPLIVAVKYCVNLEVAMKLVEMGADPNTPTSHGQTVMHDEWQRKYNRGETVLDVVHAQLKNLRKYKGERHNLRKPQLHQGMQERLDSLNKNSYEYLATKKNVRSREKFFKEETKTYEEDLKKHEEKQKGRDLKETAIKEVIADLEKLEQMLIERGAKTFYEAYPQVPEPEERQGRYRYQYDSDTGDEKKKKKEDKQPVYDWQIAFVGASDITEVRRLAYVELLEAAWNGDLEKIKSLTLQAWGENQAEPPLKASVATADGSTPFSLAFLRGHRGVAKEILEIIKAQYSPVEKDKSRYTLDTGNPDDDDSDEDGSEEDSDEDNATQGIPGHPKIVALAVDKKFTIDNIGQVSMHVDSHDKPIKSLTSRVMCFTTQDADEDEEKAEDTILETLFSHVMRHDDHSGLKFLLDLAAHYSGEKLEGDTDEEDNGSFFSFPEDAFVWAVANGKTGALAEIIKRFGAGMPLDHLVKKSGVELKQKPKYYQGLSVYGKKRKDWATAGRNLVVRQTGLKTPPLLHAALGGSIESVEWFLSDAPLRCYVEFGQSKTASEDPRLKHLSNAPGGFDRAVGKWLGIQNETVLHCAVMGPSNEKTNKVIQYLIQACPSSLEYKTTSGDTPLWLAFHLGRVDFAKTLIEAGANQSVRNKQGQNIIHAALQWLPKAHSLKDMLELMDDKLRAHLLLQRSNLQDEGTTPLHSWVNKFPDNYDHTRWTKYANKEEATAVLDLLLGYSEGAELAMLNGAGDTPLHSAVNKNSMVLIEALLTYRPSLLYRENAVGRTPAEVAHTRVISKRFDQPRSLPSHFNDWNGPSHLPQRNADNFVNEKRGRDIKTQSKDKNEETWDLLAEYLERYPAPRRLVSLSEANDVAKRLGEEYKASRYFSIQARGDDDDDEKAEEDDETSLDFASTQKSSHGWQAWKPDNAEQESSDVCVGCGERHG